VLDRDRIDSDLAKLRIDHAMWWNVRRLTPDVYRFQRDSEWLTKFDIGLFEPKGIEMRAAYVLESMIEIVRRVQISRGSYRSSGTAEYHEVTAAPNSKVLRRALLESEVVYKVGSSPTKLRVQYRSPGLDGKGSFWHVVDFWASDNHDSILIGYLSESDTQP